MLVYEDKPRYDFWLKFVLGGTLALTFVFGLVLLLQDVTGALVMFGVTVFDFLLFKASLPSRFQVFQDKLKIVLGGPFALNIPYTRYRRCRK